MDTPDDDDGDGDKGATSSAGCPSGFFACPESTGGGCCRTGRSCETESCPAADKADKEEVVEDEAQVGVCAEGWAACEAYDGGGCCPDGYVCGGRNCPAQTIVATKVSGGVMAAMTEVVGEVGKLPQKTGGGGRGEVAWGVVGAAVVMGVLGGV